MSTGHSLKLNVCDRYTGVRKSRSGKFTTRIWANGRNHFLGIYATELEAARAVDEAHIYRAHAPVNLITETYDHLEIGRHKDLESFVKHKREQVRQLSKAKQISRYQGVKINNGRWYACVHDLTSFACTDLSLGCYVDEEKAASAYDRARIFQGLDPVNFPHFPYNRAKIKQHADIDAFAEQPRRDAGQVTKARQHSRYTGVSWYSAKNAWEAYVYLSSGPKQTKTSWKKRLGFYSNEDDAAKEVDRGRVHYGQKAVNYHLLGVK